jgi:predicted N-acetyltransferase YhbS
MISIRTERPADVAAREALLDVAYGPVRFTKPSQRLRERRDPALSFVAQESGRVIGTVRLWPVSAGAGRPALLLGPLAVHPDCRRRGVGAALMRRALRAAGEAGHAAVLLVGDASYYGRFGFIAEKTGALGMPGPYEPERLLALELVPGVLDGAHGVIRVGAPRRAARRAAAAPAVAHAA